MGEPAPPPHSASLSVRVTLRITDPDSGSASALMIRVRHDAEVLLAGLAEVARQRGYEMETDIDYLVGYPS